MEIKALDFEGFCIAAETMKTKSHLSEEGAAKILALGNGMNKGCGKYLPESVKLSLLGPFFIYNPAKTILYYTTDNVKDLIDVLNIQEGALKKHLDKGTIYLKNFTFSQNLLPNVEHQLVTLDELTQIMRKILLRHNSLWRND